MVWPFSSSAPSAPPKSSQTSETSSIPATASAALDTLEQVGQDANELFQSATTSVEKMAKSSILSNIDIPPSVEPYLIATTVFGVTTAIVMLYRTRLRRIPSAAYLNPNMLQGRRVLKGKVTSVGDADNFRFYHTPGGVWAGWGWLRHVPTGTKELKQQTLHVRVAGVDAPEAAHFGMPAQPFSAEALAWLRGQLKGKTVVIKPFAKDRYDRVVAMAWYPRVLPFLPMKNVSKEMLKVGYGQVYKQAGAEYGGMMKEFEALEAKARSRKIGIWSQKNMVSAAEHKKQYLRGGE